MGGSGVSRHEFNSMQASLNTQIGQIKSLQAAATQNYETTLSDKSRQLDHLRDQRVTLEKMLADVNIQNAGLREQIGRLRSQVADLQSMIDRIIAQYGHFVKLNAQAQKDKSTIEMLIRLGEAYFNGTTH